MNFGGQQNPFFIITKLTAATTDPNAGKCLTLKSLSLVSSCKKW